MERVQILSSTTFASSIGKSFSTLPGAVSDLKPGVAPDEVSVIVVHANAKVSGAHPEIHDAGGAAAWLRRAGCTNPIVWLASEPVELKSTPGDAIANTSAQMDGGRIDLPWFAPLYDVALRVPQDNARLQEAIETAQSRKGTRRALVEAAITRALQTHLESRGAHEDHLWKNLEAVLRFLRGAQCEWMIHPEDAQAIIEEIKRQVELHKDHPDFKNWAAEANALLSKQTGRWAAYKEAFERPLRGTQIKPFTKLNRADLPYRLLLVDDQWERLGWKVLLERLLAPYGFAVEVDDGQSEVALKNELEAKQYDVILLDLNLNPASVTEQDNEDKGSTARQRDDLTGLKRLKTIRQVAPHTPIIFFTGYEWMSLERDRQQLGVLGYIVKQEQTQDKQDARGYYQRLVELCRSAIDHEIRALLKQLAAPLATIDPILYEKTEGRLWRALEELDDPLIACHQSGLAYETALCKHYATPDLAAALTKFRDHGRPFRDWAYLSRALRNSAAHREIGAEYLTPLDALLSVSFSVFVLYLLCGEDIASTDAAGRQRLISLAMRRCRDELQTLCAGHEAIISNLPVGATGTKDLRNKISSVCGLLKKASQSANESDYSGVLSSLRSLVEAVLHGVYRTVADIAPSRDLAVALREKFIDGTEGVDKTKARKDCDHTAAGASGYLDNVNAFAGRDAIDCKALEHQYLSLLAMTRMIQWAVASVAAHPNPHNKALLLGKLGLGPGETDEPHMVALVSEPEYSAFATWLENHAPMRDLMRRPPPVAEFMAGVFAACDTPYLSAALIDLGERALASLADQLLLKPNMTRLQEEFEHDTRVRQDTLDWAQECERIYEDRQSRLGNLSGRDKSSLLGDLRTYSANLDKYIPALGTRARETGVFAELLIQETPTGRKLEETKRLLEDIDHIESLQAEVREAAQEQKESAATTEKLQERLASGRRLIAYSKTLEESVSDAPALATDIVRRFAPLTLQDLQLIRACLRSWAWTSQREDLPGLLSDLEKQWKKEVIV